MSEVRLPRALKNELVPGTNTLKDRGRLSPVKVSPTLNYDSLSTVSIQLKESDIELGQHEFVEVYGEFGSLGIFRVVSRSKKIKGIYTYNLNHAFDTLSDCVIEGVDTISDSVTEVMRRLLDCQKEGIDGRKFWQLGTVQCPYSYTFDNAYDNVYDTLKDIADKYSDCCFTFDFSTFPWTLNFVNKSDEIVSELRLDRNIDEIEISENDNEQCTMLHLSVDTRDDPSVAEDAQGVTYRTITDAEAVAIWGIIEKPIGIETKEIGGASEEAIQAWIDRYMSEHKNPELSIEITGEEYAKHTGEPMDRLQLGKICRTILKKYNTVFYERIVSITYPDILKSPRHFKATLANKKLTAGGLFAKKASEQTKSSRTGRKRLQQASDYLEDYLDYLGHYIEENDQHWKSVYWDTYHGLTSRIEQTAAYWQAEFDDQYNQLHGFIDITAQHWQATYEDGYNQLWSQVEQTAAYWRSSLADTYNGLYGMVEQTAAYWRSSLADTYNGLSSRVEQTAAYWRSSLADSYNKLSSGIEAAANYAMLYTQSKTSRAYIMTQINDNTEQTEALINAEQILIGTSGNAKVNLANVITLGDSSTVLIKKDVVVNETYGANGVKLSTDGTIRGHQLTLIKTGGQEGQYAVKSITSDDIDEMVVKAAIDGNTLRLWKRGADLEATSGNGIINFSKAVTLSGAWDNGNFPLTINATQTNNGVNTNVGSKSVGFTNASDFYLTVEKNGDPTAFGSSKKLINVPFKIVHHAGGTVGDQDRYASSLASVDATSVYNNGWEDSYGEIGLNYSSDQELSGSRKNITIYPVGKGSPSADAASIISKGITVTVPYEVTDGSIVPINFGNPPTGWTKHEFTAGESKYQYHTKDGTSGSGTNVLVYFVPRLTVDGSVLNPGTAIYRSNSTIPTQIWHDAYEAGVTAGRVGYTANSSLQAPYGTAIDANTEDVEVTITANSQDSTLTLETGSYRVPNTTTDRNCIIAKVGSTTVARIGVDWKYTQSEYNTALATVPSGYVAESTYAGYVDPVTYAAAVAGQATAAANGYLSGWNAACSGSNPKNLAFEYNKSFTGGSANQGIAVTYPISSNGSSYTSTTSYFWLVDEGGFVGLWLGNIAGGTTTRVASKTYSSSNPYPTPLVLTKTGAVNTGGNNVKYTFTVELSASTTLPIDSNNHFTVHY